MGEGRTVGKLPNRRDVDAAVGRTADLNQVLGLLASAASEGDLVATETLLYAVDSQRLAEPGIRRVVFEPYDIDEISQIVLIAVAEHIRSFRGDAQFTSWLFGVSRNKALEFLRRKRDTAQMKTELGDTERISSLVANELSVQALLTEIPDRYRIAVTLRDLQGMAYADIAEKLDLNVNTVRSHISRGRALLAAMVAVGFER